MSEVPAEIIPLCGIRNQHSGIMHLPKCGISPQAHHNAHHWTACPLHAQTPHQPGPLRVMGRRVPQHHPKPKAYALKARGLCPNGARPRTPAHTPMVRVQNRRPRVGPNAPAEKPFPHSLVSPRKHGVSHARPAALATTSPGRVYTTTLPGLGRWGS